MADRARSARAVACALTAVLVCATESDAQSAGQHHSIIIVTGQSNARPRFAEGFIEAIEASGAIPDARLFHRHHSGNWMVRWIGGEAGAHTLLHGAGEYIAYDTFVEAADQAFDLGHPLVPTHAWAAPLRAMWAGAFSLRVFGRPAQLFTFRLRAAYALMRTEGEANEPAEAQAPRVLIVLTSHGTLGDTGRETGFYLSELTHVYYPLREAGVEVRLATIEGGEAPMCWPGAWRRCLATPPPPVPPPPLGFPRCRERSGVLLLQILWPGKPCR